MNKVLQALVLFFSVSSSLCRGYTPKEVFIDSYLTIGEQDTLKEKQDLYNGKMWKNNYHRIDNDQFLFVNYFLSGTISANGKTYKNVLLRYDIFSDELTIPLNREEILQVNKEIVDSFSLNYESKVYRFAKIEADSLNITNGFNGYVCILYDQKSALYLKFIKNISPNITDKSDGEFIQTNKTFLIRDKNVILINSLNDLYRALNQQDITIRDYLKKNKIKLSKKNPESLIPAIRYFDSISK